MKARLVKLCLPVVVALGLAAPALAVDDEAPYTIGANGQILQLDFDVNSSTVVNTDAAQRKSLDSLAVRDDLESLNLIAVDRGAGQILFYAGAGGAGQIIANKLPNPRGLSMGPSGGLFLTGRATSTFPFGRPRSYVWYIPPTGTHPGGYGERTIIDTPDRYPILVATLLVPTSDGKLHEGDLLVLSQKPNAVLWYRKTATGYRREVFLANRDFPYGTTPTGLAFSPLGEILVSTANGSGVLRYDTQGTRVLPDFALSGNGINGLSVGVQDETVYVYVTENTQVKRYTIQADGTGVVDTSVTTGISNAKTTSLATGIGAPTRLGLLTRALPHPLAEVTFDETTGAGLTRARFLAFADNRSGAVDQNLRAFFPGLTNLQARIPDAIVPSYVKAFPRKAPGDPVGGPYTGPETFVLTIIDTTAPLARTAQVHIDEESFLGYAPACDDPDPTLRPRTFYTPETDPPKSEPPLPEGAVFINVSTGCGSNIGRRSDFSLWLTARDTRTPAATATSMLDGTDGALSDFGSQNYITPLILADLQAIQADAASDFNGGSGGNTGKAIQDLEDAIETVDQNPGAFTGPQNVAGDVISRTQAAMYMMAETLNLSKLDIIIGDDDGYGRGIKDDEDLPNDGQTPFDARSAAEQGAADGSQQTDVYSALIDPLASTSFDVVFPLAGQKLFGATLTIDMASFQGTAFAPLFFKFNGVAQPGMVFSDGRDTTRVRRFSLPTLAIKNANAADQFVLTVERATPNTGDFIAFDYFRLQGSVGP